MIPEFDENGYLPAGVHPATMEEIERRFARGSEIRRVMHESLQWLERAAAGAGVVRIIVNGSYVTDVVEPNDVDCVVLIPPDFDANSEAALQLLGGFPFLNLELVEAAVFQDMIDFFATDRDDVAKGMIEVVK